MSRIVWWGAFVGAAFWSVLAGIAYLVFDAVGAGMAGYATVPGFPPEPFTFAWISAKLHGLGLTAIAAGWLVGMATILGGAALFQRIFGRRALPGPPRRYSSGSSFPSAPPHPR